MIDYEIYCKIRDYHQREGLTPASTVAIPSSRTTCASFGPSGHRLISP